MEFKELYRNGGIDKESDRGEKIRVLNNKIIIKSKEYPMEKLDGELTELDQKFLKVSRRWII